MRLKRFGLGTVIVAALALLWGCDGFFVSGNQLVSMTISPRNASVQPNKTQQFTATGTFGDGSTKEVTNDVTWTSSNTSVATINTTGLASTLAVGTTTITATSNSSSGSDKITENTTLTVSNTVVTSLAITPANSSIRIGETRQFTATATLSDSTTKDVTTQVAWSSSSTGVASITSTGLATGVSTGSTTITASLGSVTNNTSLNVTAF